MRFRSGDIIVNHGKYDTGAHYYERIRVFDNRSVVLSCTKGCCNNMEIEVSVDTYNENHPISLQFQLDETYRMKRIMEIYE